MVQVVRKQRAEQWAEHRRQREEEDRRRRVIVITEFDAGESRIKEADRMDHDEWTDWKPFPDPTKGDFIVAPFGPGCYELRLMGSGQLVLFGSAGHVAYRMCSLHPSGAGTRNNSKKREYVGAHLPQIEYRVIAFASRDEARDFERRELLSRRDQYIFKT